MAADAAAIQTALGLAAQSVIGLRAFPDMESINPGLAGAFVVTEIDVDYDITMRNPLAQYAMTCGVFFNRANMRSARTALTRAISQTGGSASSIKNALEADRTLGGVVKQLIVHKARGAYRIYTIGDQPYLGALFDVEVWG